MYKETNVVIGNIVNIKLFFSLMTITVKTLVKQIIVIDKESSTHFVWATMHVCESSSTKYK